MTSLQIINKVIQSGSLEIVEQYNLDIDYFPDYESEFDFILNHKRKYGNVPDRQTFVEAFADFDFIEVAESDQYLVDKIREEHLYAKAVPIVQQYASLLKVNANDAVEYLMAQMPQLQPDYNIGYVDIAQQAGLRYEAWRNRIDTPTDWFIATGFPELDDLIRGWSASGEELAVIFARTGMGKSWILDYFISHAWKLGNRVGIISPEMSATKMGYRVDTLMGHFSNAGLVWGLEHRVNKAEYEEYINNLSKQQGFFVSTPDDFSRRITASKLRNYIIANNLQVVGIDGITYLEDERSSSRDTKRVQLTNISEDLMQVSKELKVPFIVVHQSNRQGVRSEEDDGLPDIENLSESDGIAHNASKIIALRQQGNILTMGVKKHRDGKDGGVVNYQWDIDKGEFLYMPSGKDEPKQQRSNNDKQQVTTNRKVAF